MFFFFFSFVHLLCLSYSILCFPNLTGRWFASNSIYFFFGNVFNSKKKNASIFFFFRRTRKTSELRIHQVIKSDRCMEVKKKTLKWRERTERLIWVIKKTIIGWTNLKKKESQKLQPVLFFFFLVKQLKTGS